MQWGKKWPVPMNLPFFAVEAYVPEGGGVGPESGKKKTKKCLPAGTGTKIYFSRVKGVTGRDAIVHKRRRNSSQNATQ